MVPTHVHDHSRSELIAQAKAAVLRLLNEGGTGSHTQERDGHVYLFDGNDEAVRDCVTAWMACVRADGM